MTVFKLPGSAIQSNTITTTQLQTTAVTQIQSGVSSGPKVSSITYPNNQTATANTGNESIIVTGTGFEPNVKIYINGSAVPSLTRTNANSITFTTPALTTGTTYPLYVVNPDGGTAVVVPGMVVSAGPVWVTESPLTSWSAASALSRTLVATSDSTVSYALAAGSSLPSGLSLAANGLLSGTITSPPASTTTYSFTVVATDLETQKSSKAFSITGTAGVEATGGTVSNIAGYRVHTFTSSGSFVVTGSGTVEYLVIAGGGGGGKGGSGPQNYAGGGGGAGGFRTGTGLSVTAGNTYTITVGAGGAFNSNGTNSVFSTISSTFGGAGGTGYYGGTPATGQNGGSGGGGGADGRASGGLGNLGGYSPSEGNNGGTAYHSGAGYGGGGGGGGAGANGATSGDVGQGQAAGNGGVGVASSITGASTYYSGGGGGGIVYGPSGGTGGTGGGGRGTPAVDGTTNTGGGGGGSGGTAAAGAGGSGIVIIRYAA